jgi:hypothetical protein
MISKAEVSRAQKLIDSGDAWRFEGSVGRYCMDLINAGYCKLGKVGHKDYWGNYVPSRYEVKAGTKGSAKFVRDAKARRADEGMPEFE